MFVLAAAYFAITAGRSATPELRALACGLAAGAAFTVDYVDALTIPIHLAYLVASRRVHLRSAWAIAGAYLLGVFPGIEAIGGYNYSIFGSPTVFTEQGYLGHSVLGFFTTPIQYGLALDFVSLSRGMFVFAPLLVLGVMGFYDGFREGGKRLEMLLLLSLFLSVLVPYSMWYGPTGGPAFGPRFLVTAIPFLLIPAGVIVDAVKGKKMWLVYAVFAAGALVNGLAAQVSAIAPPTPFNVSQFMVFTIPGLKGADFSTLWSVFLGHLLPFALLLVAALGIAVPILWVESTRRGEKEGRSGCDPLSLTKSKRSGPDKRRAASPEEGPWRTLHSLLCAFACGGLTFGAR